jgi:hypothetical protein
MNFFFSNFFSATLLDICVISEDIFKNFVLVDKYEDIFLQVKILLNVILMDKCHIERLFYGLYAAR